MSFAAIRSVALRRATAVPRTQVRFYADNKGAMAQAGEAMKKAGQAFKSDGAIGKQFEGDGNIGQVGEAVGGPFSSKGAVGKNFTGDGAVGGSVNESAEDVKQAGKETKSDAKHQ
ncbi:hypothetical protein IAU60_004312 [Kwoniella sp. DSM 27419]